MKKYYHVSFDIENIIEKFIPKLQNGLLNEDNITKRVCVADTLEGCLFATPMYHYIKNIDEPYEAMLYYRINKETNNGGIVVRLYEFERESDEFLIKNEELILNKLVPDAYLSGEAWITKEIKPTNSYLILINNDNATHIPNGTPWEQIKECPIKNVRYEIIQDIANLDYVDMI